MISTASRLFLLGGVFFLLGVLLLFLGGDNGSRVLLRAGVGLFLLSAAGLAAGCWTSRKERGPLERRREQRLWRSGPLGRRWLKSRNRLR
jgi:hypothetical protein